MNIIQQIFTQYAMKYIYSKYVPENIKKAVISIISCRTEKIKKRRLQICSDCGYEEYSYCSCRNRSCPACQTYTKEKWINSRLKELISTRYFHIVFTVPDILNDIIYYNQGIMYNILFKAVSETLLDLGKDKKLIGAQIGATMVLHTWCQKLLYHPHLHCIVPGGGLNNGRWITSKKKIFIHVAILSKVFKGKFLEKLQEAYKEGDLWFPKRLEHLYDVTKFDDLMQPLYKKSWYVYSKKTFKGPKAVIEYLGRYTHKIAITNSRIVSFENGKVTFKWRDNKDGGKQKIMTLTAKEFIRRYLLHVLPTGFMKIRYIGIISNRNKNTKLKLCQKLTNTVLDLVKSSAEDILLKMTKGNLFICPACKGTNFKLASVLNPLNST